MFVLEEEDKNLYDRKSEILLDNTMGHCGDEKDRCHVRWRKCVQRQVSQRRLVMDNNILPILTHPMYILITTRPNQPRIYIGLFNTIAETEEYAAEFHFQNFEIDTVWPAQALGIKINRIKNST